QERPDRAALLLRRGTAGDDAPRPRRRAEGERGHQARSENLAARLPSPLTMDSLSFLDFDPDFSAPHIVDAYDELPLWSAMFGLLLLDELPMTPVATVLDVVCGTGFPLIELAERLGPTSHVHGVDTWSAALSRASEKIACRRTLNVSVHEASATSMPVADGTFDVIVSNLAANTFDDSEAAMKEFRRVAKSTASIALTS